MQVRPEASHPASWKGSFGTALEGAGGLEIHHRRWREEEVEARGAASCPDKSIKL